MQRTLGRSGITVSAMGLGCWAIGRACIDSLQRLGTDYVDLYQLHAWSIPLEEVEELVDALDGLRREGLIRAYGWSTSDPDCARRFAELSSGAAIQHPLNVLSDAPEVLALCAEHDMASICNGPLAMGLLSGKFDSTSRLPIDDVRGSGHTWVQYFSEGRPRQEFLDTRILSRSRRTPVPCSSDH